MQKFMKPIISLLSIAVFLAIALATGPDASTNTTVAISNCMDKPQVSGIVKVNVSFNKSDGTPIPLANGRIYITDQNVLSTSACDFAASSDQVDFITGPDGKYSYAGDEYSHDNSEDLLRVEVVLFKSGSFEECKPAVQVGKYNNYTFNFNCTGKSLADL